MLPSLSSYNQTWCVSYHLPPCWSLYTSDKTHMKFVQCTGNEPNSSERLGGVAWEWDWSCYCIAGNICGVQIFFSFSVDQKENLTPKKCSDGCVFLCEMDRMKIKHTNQLEIAQNEIWTRKFPATQYSCAVYTHSFPSQSQVVLVHKLYDSCLPFSNVCVSQGIKLASLGDRWVELAHCLGSVEEEIQGFWDSTN